MGVELNGLRGKVAVVTGAGRMRSIGRSIAQELARGGCDVIVTGSGRPPQARTPDEEAAQWRDIHSVADEIRALGRRSGACVADVADEAAVDRLLEEVVAEHGKVDILVNNAAAARGEDRVPLTELPSEVWDNVMRVNVRGTFLMTRRFAQRMVEKGNGGAIINISSVAGKIGSPSAAAYAASKAAVQSLTVSAARELAGDRIRVNALCPGIVSTSRLSDWPTERWDRVIAGTVPLGRAGNPQEIAWAAAYLASDQGSWITGQAWNIDGGQVTMR